MFGIRSRFIFFMLIAAVLPPLSALLVTLHYSSAAKLDFEQRLTRTSKALQAQIETEAAVRSEVLLKLERLQDIVEPVKEAFSAKQPAPARAATKLHDAIAELFQHDAPSLMAVATPMGAQVIIGNADPVAAEIKDLPSANTALTGQSVKLFAMYNNSLYRFTAMPVGIAEGAIIIGDKIGESSALRWREASAAGEVTLVFGGKSVVSSAKPELRDAVAGLAKRTGTLSTGHSGLGWPQLGFLDRFLPIGLPNPAQGSIGAEIYGVFAVVTIPTDTSWMGGVQALGFICGFLVLVVGLVWMQMIYGPILRQARSIEAHLARLKVERNAKLTTKGFSTPFSAVVDHLDKLTEFWNAREAQLVTQAQAAREATPAAASTSVETPRAVIARAPVALPLEVGIPTEPESIDHAFPFGDREKDKLSGKIQKARPAMSEDPTEAPTPAATPRQPKPAAAPAARSAGPAARVAPAPKGTVPLSAPEPSGPVPLPGGPRGGTPKAPAFDDEDLPPDLLARSQELEEELLAPAEDPEEEHFHAVFDEFVAVRRKCGEPADGLTFEKFHARLQKNRDQLIEKFACKTVRFQVYVKDGKAAVKALPVH